MLAATTCSSSWTGTTISTAGQSPIARLVRLDEDGDGRRVGRRRREGDTGRAGWRRLGVGAGTEPQPGVGVALEPTAVADLAGVRGIDLERHAAAAQLGHDRPRVRLGEAASGQVEVDRPEALHRAQLA